MFNKLTDKFNAAFFEEAGIHISGNREILLENCRRIEECSDVLMSLACGKLLIHIWGNNLRAFDYKTGGLVIRGKIAQIELEERSRK